MVKMKCNIHFLEADEDSGRLNEALFTSVKNAAHDRKQKLIILTDRCQSAEENAQCFSIRQLFLHLYREHKLGGSKTETFLSHDEHLVVVQLCIASWNKMENDTFEADVHSVLKVSNEILRRKMGSHAPKDHQSSPNVYSKLDISSTSKSHKPPQIQSPSGQSHSCFGIPACRTTPRKCTSGLPLPGSPKTPAGVTANLHLGSSPKTPEQNLDSQTISEILEHYNQFVQKCHKVDIVDVFLKVKDYFSSNADEEALFAQENLFVVEHIPRTGIEKEMCKFLAGDVLVNCLSLNPDVITNFTWEKIHLGGEDVHLTKLPVSSIWKSSQPFVLPSAVNLAEETSVSERFIRKVFLSYISLLVNSADELALARCLCLPDRGLSHKGFTALKHLAAKKKMSMFLTAFSFVFEMRRVKAASDSYSPLFAYPKPLGEFVDLADKLMTITQDIPSVELNNNVIGNILPITENKSTKKEATFFPDHEVYIWNDVFEMRRVKAASDSYSPLFAYSKPLGEFVDLADKLMTITQDIPSVDLAVEKVLKTLKITLSKSRTSVFRPASVEKVYSKLLTEIQHLLQKDMLDLEVTPKPVGSGGSMRGQKVIKLFRSILDIESTKLCQNQATEDLFDQQSSQNTPVRFPSLLSQFSSPQVIEKPLEAKCNDNKNESKTDTTISYTKSHYGWVAPNLTVKENYPLNKYSWESDTAGSKYKPQHIHNRPIQQETADDKNHKDEQLTESPTKAPMSSISASKDDKTAPEEDPSLSTPNAASKVKKNKGPSLKRKKLQLEQNEKLKRARKGDSKKKTIPASKGQKLLTNFFRTSKPATTNLNPDQ